jgi:hypothetical protein
MLVERRALKGELILSADAHDESLSESHAYGYPMSPGTVSTAQRLEMRRGCIARLRTGQTRLRRRDLKYRGAVEWRCFSQKYSAVEMMPNPTRPQKLANPTRAYSPGDKLLMVVNVCMLLLQS